MSLYAELRRGPVRAWSPRSNRNRFDIYSRMLNRRRNRRNVANACYNRGGCRNRPRATNRDLEFEKKRMTPEEKTQVEGMEKEAEEEEEKNKLQDAKVEKLKKKILMVEKTNLHVFETTIEQYTDKYHCTEGFNGQLVVRRGQEFRISFTFQRPWSGKQDDLYLVFSIGENPNFGKGTKVKVKLEEGNDTQYKDGPKKKWGACISNQHENTLTVNVYVPPNAIIGQWEYTVITEFVGKKGNKKKYPFDGKDDIIILLNPFCKDDQVYMESESDRNEYIFNECGCVFNGSYKSIGVKSWFYGQFRERILDISLHLLRKAFDYEIGPKMADPIQIARGLSRIVNACDDNGVLIGNWSGDYSGGTPPTKWKGSVRILEQYDDDKEPVKYGQCWVFSHVLTTVARALGFPCRSVTNFASSHDTSNNMTIDKFVDDDGNPIPGLARDSIWNFHVWNEVWMRRPDLDKLMDAQRKFDGWHAIDATPQEASDNVFQCGPSPLAAIQCGDVHVGFDTKFIFAEVNADVCYWRETAGDLILVDKNSRLVGKKISTKVPNGDPMDSSFFARDEDNRLDITHLYKHPEGSVAERECMMKALTGTEHYDEIFSNATGIEMTFKDMPELKLGEDITTTLTVKNTSKEVRSVRVKLTVRPMTYWGEVIGTKWVATDTFSEVKIKPNQTQTYELVCKPDQYLDVCDEQMAMSALAMAYVRDFPDHQNRVYASDDFRVKSGIIEVQGPTKPVSAGDIVELELICKNPTDKTLTKCVIEIEGGIEVEESGFKKEKSVYRKNIDNIKPQETVSMKVRVKPKAKPSKCFEREVDIDLMSEEVPDFEGSYMIKLKK